MPPVSKSKTTKKPRKTKKRAIKIAPAPNPYYYHIYRVNRAKTIFWQMPQNYDTEQQAEIEASRLDSLAVIQRKSHFYMVLDGWTSLYLWQTEDVRAAK